MSTTPNDKNQNQKKDPFVHFDDDMPLDNSKGSKNGSVKTTDRFVDFPDDDKYVSKFKKKDLSSSSNPSNEQGSTNPSSETPIQSTSNGDTNNNQYNSAPVKKNSIEFLENDLVEANAKITADKKNTSAISSYFGIKPVAAQAEAPLLPGMKPKKYVADNYSSLLEYSKERKAEIEKEILDLQKSTAKFSAQNIQSPSMMGGISPTSVSSINEDHPSVKAKKDYLDKLNKSIADISPELIIKKQFDEAPLSFDKKSMQEIGVLSKKLSGLSNVDDDLGIIKNIKKYASFWGEDGKATLQEKEASLWVEGMNVTSKYLNKKLNTSLANMSNTDKQKLSEAVAITDKPGAISEDEVKKYNEILANPNIKEAVNTLGSFKSLSNKYNADFKKEFPEVARRVLRKQAIEELRNLRYGKDGFPEVNNATGKRIWDAIFGMKASEEDIPAIAKKLNVSEKDVKDIYDRQVKTGMGFNSGRSELGTYGFVSAIAEGIDGLGASAKQGVNRIALDKQPADVRNAIISTRKEDYALNTQAASLFKNGEINLNLESVVNTIGETTGQLMGFMLPNAVIGNVLKMPVFLSSGYSNISPSVFLNDAITKGLLATTDAAITTGVGAVSSYEDAYQEAAKYTTDQSKRHTYATVQAIVTGLSENILSPSRMLDKLSFGGKIKGSYKSFEKNLKKEGIGAAFGKAVLAGLKEGGAVVAEETAEELVPLITELGVGSAVLDKPVDYSKFYDDVVQTVVQTALGTSLLGGLSGLRAGSDRSRIMRESLFEAGMEPERHIDHYRELRDNGNIKPEKANEIISAINTVRSIVKSLPDMGHNGKPLTTKDAVDLTSVLFRERYHNKKAQDAANLGDDVAVAEETALAEQASAEAQTILSGETTNESREAEAEEADNTAKSIVEKVEASNEDVAKIEPLTEQEVDMVENRPDELKAYGVNLFDKLMSDLKATVPTVEIENNEEATTSENITNALQNFSNEIKTIEDETEKAEAEKTLDETLSNLDKVMPGFDFNKIIAEQNKSPEQVEQERVVAVEAEREEAYQKGGFDKKWAKTYTQAKQKLTQQYQQAKKTKEAWEKRKYKSAGDKTVSVGGELDGDNVSVDYINEKRKADNIKNAEGEMSDARNGLSELGLTEIEITDLLDKEPVVTKKDTGEIGSYQKGDTILWQGEEREIASTVQMGNETKYKIDLGDGKHIWTNDGSLDAENNGVVLSRKGDIDTGSSKVQSTEDQNDDVEDEGDKISDFNVGDVIERGGKQYEILGNKKGKNEGVIKMLELASGNESDWNAENNGGFKFVESKKSEPTLPADKNKKSKKKSSSKEDLPKGDVDYKLPYDLLKKAFEYYNEFSDKNSYIGDIEDGYRNATYRMFKEGIITQEIGDYLINSMTYMGEGYVTKGLDYFINEYRSAEKAARDIAEMIANPNPDFYMDDLKEGLIDFGVSEKTIDASAAIISELYNNLEKNDIVTDLLSPVQWLSIGAADRDGNDDTKAIVGSLKLNGKDVDVRSVNADVVDGFYSPLEKIINETKFDKLPAKQWIEKFAKGEEAKWTGLAGWLEQQNGSVGKSDIQKYLKENRVGIVEVIKGGERGNDYSQRKKEIEDTINAKGYSFQLDMGGEGYMLVDKDGELVDYDELPEGFEELSEEYNEISGPNFNSNSKLTVNDAQYGGWTLPGEKKNYREFLVIYSNSGGPYTAHLYTAEDDFNVVGSKKGDWIIKNRRGEEVSYVDSDYATTEEEALQEFELNQLPYENEDDNNLGGNIFKHNHFREYNILFHVRMDDRVDADGSKVLFLEEVQSDWAQKGRKEGFSDSDIENKKKRFYEIEKKIIQVGTKGLTESELAEWKKLKSTPKVMERGFPPIPSAPFVTDTNSWVKLALKVALKEAVKKGANKIAWTTGEQQSDRYNLSKQVDLISYVKNDNGAYSIAGRKNNETIFSHANVEPKRLEDYIGKEVAQKILNNEGVEGDRFSHMDNTPKKMMELSGEDLKVGSKGMNGFYGSQIEGKIGIIGNVAKSLFKQELKTIVLINGTTEHGVFDTKPEAKEYINRFTKQDFSEFGEPVIEESDGKFKVVSTGYHTQPSIDVTTDLKLQVKSGLPLFKKIKNIRGISNTAKLKSSEYYNNAKSGDIIAANNLVNDIVTDRHVELIKERLKGIKGAIIAPVITMGSVGSSNAIPNALAYKIRQITGFKVDTEISKYKNKAHTAANREQRFSSVAEFEGKVQKGKKYVIVDDVSSSGSTLKAMKDYIESNGGDVVDVIVVAVGKSGGRFEPTLAEKQEMIDKFGKAPLRSFLKATGRDINNLTKKEVDFVKSFDTLEKAIKTLAKISEENKLELFDGKRYAITATDALRKEEDRVEGQFYVDFMGNRIVESLQDFSGTEKGATTIMHEVMHGVVTSVFSSYDTSDKGFSYSNTIINEYNKVNPNAPVTLEQMISDNNSFIQREGTTDAYRSVQEFIAQSWEKYLYEGPKGFSGLFKEFLQMITDAFRSVYSNSSVSGVLTPELREMFDDFLGGETEMEPYISEESKQYRKTVLYNTLKELSKPIAEFNVGDVVSFITDSSGRPSTIVTNVNGEVTFTTKNTGTKEASSASGLQENGNDLAVLRSTYENVINSLGDSSMDLYYHPKSDFDNSAENNNNKDFSLISSSKNSENENSIEIATSDSEENAKRKQQQVFSEKPSGETSRGQSESIGQELLINPDETELTEDKRDAIVNRIVSLVKEYNNTPANRTAVLSGLNRAIVSLSSKLGMKVEFGELISNTGGAAKKRKMIVTDESGKQVRSVSVYVQQVGNEGRKFLEQRPQEFQNFFESILPDLEADMNTRSDRYTYHFDFVLGAPEIRSAINAINSGKYNRNAFDLLDELELYFQEGFVPMAVGNGKNVMRDAVDVATILEMYKETVDYLSRDNWAEMLPEQIFDFPVTWFDDLDERIAEVIGDDYTPEQFMDADDNGMFDEIYEAAWTDEKMDDFIAEMQLVDELNKDLDFYKQASPFPDSEMEGLYFTPTGTIENQEGIFGNGYYFLESQVNAVQAAITQIDTELPIVGMAFLDSKNPFYMNGRNHDLEAQINNASTFEGVQSILSEKGYDGIVMGDTRVVFDQSQIKQISYEDVIKVEQARTEGRNAILSRNKSVPAAGKGKNSKRPIKSREEKIGVKGQLSKIERDEVILEANRLFNGTINPDDIRELLRPYGYNGTNALSYNFDMDYILTNHYSDILVANADQGKNIHFILGGPGVGKSKITREAEGDIIWDGVFTNREKLTSFVEEAIRFEIKPKVSLIYNLPLNAYSNIIKRYLSGKDKRVVGLRYFINAFDAQASRGSNLKSQFGEDIEVLLYDNSSNTNEHVLRGLDEEYLFDYSIDDSVIDEIRKLIQNEQELTDTEKSQFLGEFVGKIESTGAGQNNAEPFEQSQEGRAGSGAENIELQSEVPNEEVGTGLIKSPEEIQLENEISKQTNRVIALEAKLKAKVKRLDKQIKDNTQDLFGEKADAALTPLGFDGFDINARNKATELERTALAQERDKLNQLNKKLEQVKENPSAQKTIFDKDEVFSFDKLIKHLINPNTVITLDDVLRLTDMQSAEEPVTHAIYSLLNSYKQRNFMGMAMHPSLSSNNFYSKRGFRFYLQSLFGVELPEAAADNLSVNKFAELFEQSFIKNNRNNEQSSDSSLQGSSGSRGVGPLRTETSEDVSGQVPGAIPGGVDQQNIGSTSGGIGESVYQQGTEQDAGRNDGIGSQGSGMAGSLQAVGPVNYRRGDDYSDTKTFNKATKYQDNIDALNVLLELNTTGNVATPEQQNILSKYVGFGGLKEILINPELDWNPTDERYKPYVAQIVDIIGKIDPDGKLGLLEDARKGIETAHYTPYEVIKSIWRGIVGAGFNGGALLETSAGIGNYLMAIPPSIKNIGITAVEKDRLTGMILGKLMPRANVVISGLENANLPENAYDLIISNVPFGNFGVYDKEFNSRGAEYSAAAGSIHNYFFVKALDLVRPGGVISFITSRYTMDSTDNTAVRKLIASKAEFLGAIRLPDTTFKGNAGTSVVADIIFLRKYDEGEFLLANQPFISSTPEDVNGQSIVYNNYFKMNPEMMLGSLEAVTNQFGSYVFNLAGDKNESLSDLIDAVMPKVFNKNIFTNSQLKRNRDASNATSNYVERADYDKIGNLVVLPTGEVVKPTGEIYVDPELDSKAYNIGIDPNSIRKGQYNMENVEKLEANGMKVSDFTRMAATIVKIGSKHQPKMKHIVRIRQLTSELLYKEREGYPDEVIEPIRTALKEIYEDFVKKFGRLNTEDNKVAIKNDVDQFLILALEKQEKTKEGKKLPWEPSDILSMRTINPIRKFKDVNSLSDAIVISFDQFGGINIDKIASLLKTTPEQVIENDTQNLIFKLPDGSYAHREEYLSGDVKAKLAEVKSLPGFERNEKALEEVQPEDIAAVDIYSPLSTRWMPVKYITDFIKESFKVDAIVTYSPSLDEHDIRILSNETSELSDFSTERKSAKWLLEQAVSGYEPVVRYTAADDKVYVDEKDTALAREKYAKVREMWDEWKFSNEERRIAIQDLYNEKYNFLVERKWDGSHLELPGLLGYKARDHQKDATWRTLQQMGGILDHMVGAGKSLVMIMTAMEGKRLGKFKKPMITGLKSQLPGFAEDFKKAYPLAKVLFPSEQDFEAKNRKRLLNQIATNDWDCVMITHDNLNRILPNPESVETVVEELKHDIEVDMANTTDKSMLKKLQRKLDNIQTKLEKLSDVKKDDDLLDFGQLGIDFLMVDESQEYKNLEYSTKFTGVRGLGNQAGSKRAFGLLMHIRYLQNLYGGDKGTLFASGTPISNTMAELFLLNKYLQPSILRKLGMMAFDKWANQFAEVNTALEFYMGKYKEVSRFRKFANLPELIKLLYRNMADVRNSTNLELPRPKAVHNLNKIDATGEQLMYIRKLQEFVESKGNAHADFLGLTNGYDEEKGINPAASVMAITFAKKLSLDPRLVGGNAGNKIDKAATDIAKIYFDTEEYKGTQLVFSDIGTPKSSNSVENLYDYLVEEHSGHLTQTDLDEIFGENFLDAPKKPSLTIIKSKLLEIEPSTGIRKYLDVTPDELEQMIIEANAAVKFDAYSELKNQLIRRGVKADEIAFIHDYSSRPSKEKLFAKVRNGEIRILVGSTKKLGVGVNVQDRIVALHHLDITWKPADLEQRNGRGERQGNFVAEQFLDNKLPVYYYATERTLDAYMYELVGTKAKMIAQMKVTGNLNRMMEDLEEEIDMDTMAAELSGDPIYKERATLQKKIKELNNSKKAYDAEKYRNQDKARVFQMMLDGSKTSLKNYNNVLDAIAELNKEPYKLDKEEKAEFDKTVAKFKKDGEYNGITTDQRIIKDIAGPKGFQLNGITYPLNIILEDKPVKSTTDLNDKLSALYGTMMLRYGIDGNTGRSKEIKIGKFAGLDMIAFLKNDTFGDKTLNMYLSDGNGNNLDEVLIKDQGGVVLKNSIRKIEENIQKAEDNIEYRTTEIPKILEKLNVPYSRQEEFDKVSNRLKVVDEEIKRKMREDEENRRRERDDEDPDEPTTIAEDAKVEYTKLSNGKTVKFKSYSKAYSLGLPGIESEETEGADYSIMERVFTEVGGYHLMGKEKINNSHDAAWLFRSLEDSAIEHTFAVFVKEDGSYMTQNVGVGSVTASVVDVSSIIAVANKMKAKKVFMVHNHPSGNLVASTSDTNIVTKMAELLPGVEFTALIINTTSGKYLEIETNLNVSGQFAYDNTLTKDFDEREYLSDGVTKPIKVYQFSKVNYIKNIAPTAITSSSDVTAFVSSRRYGAGPKAEVLITNRRNYILGKFSLSYDGELSAKDFDPKSKVFKQILDKVIFSNGLGFIMVSNQRLPKDAVDAMVRNFNKVDVTALDYIQVQSAHSINRYMSYSEEGMIQEPGHEYISANDSIVNDSGSSEEVMRDKVKSLAFAAILKGMSKAEFIELQPNLNVLDKRDFRIAYEQMEGVVSAISRDDISTAEIDAIKSNFHSIANAIDYFTITKRAKAGGFAPTADNNNVPPVPPAEADNRYYEPGDDNDFIKEYQIADTGVLGTMATARNLDSLISPVDDDAYFIRELSNLGAAGDDLLELAKQKFGYHVDEYAPRVLNLLASPSWGNSTKTIALTGRLIRDLQFLIEEGVEDSPNLIRYRQKAMEYFNRTAGDAGLALNAVKELYKTLTAGDFTTFYTKEILEHRHQEALSRYQDISDIGISDDLAQNGSVTSAEDVEAAEQVIDEEVEKKKAKKAEDAKKYKKKSSEANARIKGKMDNIIQRLKNLKC